VDAELKSSLTPYRLRLLTSASIALSCVLSISATLRGGYVGPDYPVHLARLIEWAKMFDFGSTNPPLYYLLGHALFLVIGSNNVFPITVSIIQILINAVSMWFFFQYIEQRFTSRRVYLALVLVLTFLPVRIIHSTTIGTDSMTVPLFVLLLFLFDKILADKTPNLTSAALSGVALGAAIGTKYSFMALLPVWPLLFVCLAMRRHWKFPQFCLVCLLSLGLPSTISGYSFWASSRVHGYNTEKHWARNGQPADMDYADLFSIKRSDFQLFRAPENFKRDIFDARGHGYLALSHFETFTDAMNLFQQLSVPQRFGALLIPDQKTRQPWKTPVMQASMTLGVLWTLMALVGTPWLGTSVIRRLFQDRLRHEDLALLFGTAYFLLMFLPIPFVHGGALFGYWTPRLILPALLGFFLSGFLLVDRKIGPYSEIARTVMLVLAVAQSVVVATMLA